MGRGAWGVGRGAWAMGCRARDVGCRVWDVGRGAKVRRARARTGSGAQRVPRPLGLAATGGVVRFHTFWRAIRTSFLSRLHIRARPTECRGQGRGIGGYRAWRGPKRGLWGWTSERSAGEESAVVRAAVPAYARTTRTRLWPLRCARAHAPMPRTYPPLATPVSMRVDAVAMVEMDYRRLVKDLWLWL